jgi:hypothetical protein
VLPSHGVKPEPYPQSGNIKPAEHLGRKNSAEPPPPPRCPCLRSVPSCFRLAPYALAADADHGRPLRRARGRAGLLLGPLGPTEPRRRGPGPVECWHRLPGHELHAPAASIAAWSQARTRRYRPKVPRVGANGLQSATGRYGWPTGCSLVAICSLRTRAAVARSPGLSRAVARWPRLIAAPPSHAVLVMPSLPEPQPLRAGCA